MRAVQFCNRQGCFLRNKKAARSWKGVRLWNQASLSSNPLLSFISHVWKINLSNPRTFLSKNFHPALEQWPIRNWYQHPDFLPPSQGRMISPHPLPRHLHIPEDKVGTLKCRPCQQGLLPLLRRRSLRWELQMTSIKSCLESLESWEIPRPCETVPGAWVSEALAGSVYGRLADWGQFQVLSQRPGHSWPAVLSFFLKH